MCTKLPLLLLTIITPERTESHPWQRRVPNIDYIRTHYTTYYIFRAKLENSSKIKNSVLKCYRNSLPYILISTYSSMRQQWLPTNMSLIKQTMTPWIRVTLVKLTATRLVKKFPGCYEIRTLIAVFTRDRHCRLYWDKLIRSTPSRRIYFRVVARCNHSNLKIY
jgi:hypothetical protein